MLKSDIEEEIERLKIRKIEITNKINLISNFDEKEEMKSEVQRIQKQIETLEKFSTK
jgi:hypothetical protein